MIEIEYVLYCETDGEVLRGLDAIIRAARRSTNVFLFSKWTHDFAYVVPFLFCFHLLFNRKRRDTHRFFDFQKKIYFFKKAIDNSEIMSIISNVVA